LQLEERTVGDYTVKELTLGTIMDLRDQFPDGGNTLTLAMLGASVHNGSGQPIGPDGARNLPARIATRLSGIVAELTGDVPGGEEKNG
jgi:hypothetical protein